MPKRSRGLTAQTTIQCEQHGAQRVALVVLANREIVGRCPLCEVDAASVAAARKRDGQLRVLYAQIPARYHDRTFSNYRTATTSQHRIKKVCAAFAANFDTRSHQGCSLVLSGSPGTGKTHLVCAIARDVVLLHGRTVWYVTAAHALRQVKATYGTTASGTERDALERFQKPDLLILDEVGGGSDYERAMLSDVLCERYARVRPTVLVSNLSRDELAAYLGERTMDRFREGDGAVLVLQWDSYRDKVAGDAALSWPGKVSV